MMNHVGVIVITAFISPDERPRMPVHHRAGALPRKPVPSQLILDTCRAVASQGSGREGTRRGKCRSSRGISAPYEPPATPDLISKPGNVIASKSGRGRLFDVVAARFV